MIRHQIQPSPKSCGQTCLAMLLGVPVAQVIADIPDRAATRAGQLCAYLVMHGWKIAAPLRYRGILPDLCIVRVVALGRRASAVGHWIVRADGKWFDPCAAGPRRELPAAGRVVSFIALAPPPLKIGRTQ